MSRSGCMSRLTKLHLEAFWVLLRVKNGKISIESFSMYVHHPFGCFFLRENPFNLPVFAVLLGISKAWASVIVGPLYPQNPASLRPRRADFKLQCQTKPNPIGTAVCSSARHCLITSRWLISRLCICLFVCEIH